MYEIWCEKEDRTFFEEAVFVGANKAGLWKVGEKSDALFVLTFLPFNQYHAVDPSLYFLLNILLTISVPGNLPNV